MCACIHTNTYMGRKTRISNNTFYQDKKRNLSFFPLNAVLFVSKASMLLLDARLTTSCHFAEHPVHCSY